MYTVYLEKHDKMYNKKKWKKGRRDKIIKTKYCTKQVQTQTRINKKYEAIKRIQK